MCYLCISERRNEQWFALNPNDSTILILCYSKNLNYTTQTPVSSLPALFLPLLYGMVMPRMPRMWVHAIFNWRVVMMVQVVMQNSIMTTV